MIYVPGTRKLGSNAWHDDDDPVSRFPFSDVPKLCDWCAHKEREQAYHLF